MSIKKPQLAAFFMYFYAIIYCYFVLTKAINYCIFIFTKREHRPFIDNQREEGPAGT